MRPEIEKWWKQANKDLDTAKFNFKGKKYEASAFFSQQAVEKGLKAMYIKKFKELLRTHDLVLLAKKIGLPDELIDLCKELSPAYTYTRYPDVVNIRKIKSVSKKLIEHAEEVLRWVQKNL